MPFVAASLSDPPGRRFARCALLALGLAACDPAPTDRGAAPTAGTMEPAAVLFELPSGAGSISPSFVTDGDDLLYVWQEPVAAAAEPAPWRVRFSRWHGAWSPPVDLAQGADVLANWADFPSVGVSPDGTLLAHWLRATPDAYAFSVVRSTDGGATWAPVAGPFPPGLTGERGFVSYAAEPGGLRLYWLDGREGTDRAGAEQAGATALRSALWGPSGFGPEEVVDSRTCDCCATDAVVSRGAGVVVYRDRLEPEQRDISAAFVADGAWRSGIPVGGDGWDIHGCPVNGPAADARGDTVAAAWFTGAGDQQSVRAAFSVDAGRTFAAAVDVVEASTDARPLGRADLLLEPEGTALVVWLSAEGEDARVRIRRVGRDGRVGPSLDLGASAAGRAAGFPRVARLGSRVTVAWTTPAGNTAWALDPSLVPAVEGVNRPAPAAPATHLPAFEAPDLTGAAVRAESLRGSPALLNVWATWCGPCREELPALAELQRAHPGVRVLALSVDGPAAGAAVRKLVDARAPGLVVLHPDADDLAGRLGVSSLPRTFLFDRTGAVAWSSTGALDVDDPAFVAAISRAEQP